MLQHLTITWFCYLKWSISFSPKGDEYQIFALSSWKINKCSDINSLKRSVDQQINKPTDMRIHRKAHRQSIYALSMGRLLFQQAVSTRHRFSLISSPFYFDRFPYISIPRSDLYRLIFPCMKPSFGSLSGLLLLQGLVWHLFRSL